MLEGVDIAFGIVHGVDHARRSTSNFSDHSVIEDLVNFRLVLVCHEQGSNKKNHQGGLVLSDHVGFGKALSRNGSWQHGRSKWPIK